MTDPTAIPSDDADERGADELDDDDAGPGEREVDAGPAPEDKLAPEEELLEGWLPEAEPTDGPAPAP